MGRFAVVHLRFLEAAAGLAQAPPTSGQGDEVHTASEQAVTGAAGSALEIQALTQFGDAWSRLKPGPLARYLKPERANLKSLADPPFLDIHRQGNAEFAIHQPV